MYILATEDSATSNKSGCEVVTFHSEPRLHWFAARSFCKSRGQDLVDDLILSHYSCQYPGNMFSGFWVGLYRVSWQNEGKT